MTLVTKKLPSFTACLISIIALTSQNASHAGAYVFAGEANGVNLVTHPTGYTGTGGPLAVRVCIDPGSANAAAMEIPVQNNITIYNQLQPTTGNIALNSNNNIPSGNVDFESVALHEIGHCIGMAHVNAATESGLTGNNQNYTKATDGSDNVFNIGPGADGIIGSEDDVRGDDINLHWFGITNNNPFTIANTVDSSTYARNIANLPTGHAFAANADRTLANALGFNNTEAVMQQGTFFDEAQRTLAPDDVATLQYAESGLDAVANNGDDYSIVLEYGGLSTSGCDVTLDFDDSQTGFAVCQTGGVFLNSTHGVINSANIYFNNGFNWFFNTETVNQPPVLAVIGNLSVNEGDTLSVNLSASNPDGDSQSFSSTGLPAFATLTDHGDNTATLDIVPLAGDAASYPVTISVTDDGLPALQDSEAFSLVITADADGDGIADGSDNCPNDANPLQENNDADSLGDVCDPDDDNDGLSDIDEASYSTDPFLDDTDSDGVNDGDEVNLYNIDPLTSNLGDVAPRGAPDNQLTAGDLVVLTRLANGIISPTALESILADMNIDGNINAADLLLLQQQLLSP